jgi:hypothetical protein
MPNIPNKLHSFIDDYIKNLEKVIELSTIKDKDKFIQESMSSNLESSFMKIFVSGTNNLMDLAEDYKDTLEDLEVSAESNPILDYDLADNDKNFNSADFTHLEPVSSEYINDLEQVEIKENDTTLHEEDVSIDVEVDSIDINGNAKFKVFTIEEGEITKPFKAVANLLPKAKLDVLAQAFIKREIISIKGDITKEKGKIGLIRADILKNTNQIKKPSLFDQG